MEFREEPQMHINKLHSQCMRIAFERKVNANSPLKRERVNESHGAIEFFPH